MLQRKSNVFNNHRGAVFTHRTDGRKSIFTHPPQQFVHRRVLAERDMLFFRQMRNGVIDLLQLLFQCTFVRGVGFY